MATACGTQAVLSCPPRGGTGLGPRPCRRSRLARRAADPSSRPPSVTLHPLSPSTRLLLAAPGAFIATLAGLARLRVLQTSFVTAFNSRFTLGALITFVV